MGSTHALTGAVTWMALVPVLPYDGLRLGVGAVACAGAALLPDIDHRSATAATAGGFLTRALSFGVTVTCGGHRSAKGTHTIGVGVLIVAGLSLAALHWPLFGVLLGLYLAGMVVKAWRLPRRWRRRWPYLLATAGLSTVAVAVLPLALLVGYGMHLLGDMVTTRGLRVTGSRRVYRITPWKMATNGWWEKALRLVLFVVLAGQVALVVS